MRPTNHSLPLAALVAAATAFGGCATGIGSDEIIDNDPPLSDLDDLFDGTPKNDDVTRSHGKFDELLAARSVELRDVMTPVKSQGSRGVCSIFSTIGLMENLYVVEGTITEPDFSEQYLQWSAKFEVGSFPNTSGSNAHFNLQAINRFGVPAEGAWAYESTQWSTSNDAACSGEDDQPTRCYTNGQPSDETRAAEKFFLPRGSFLNTRDIKAHMQTTGTGVVVGFTFFYQSWNHRRSELPTTSENWDGGIVLYPNAKDKEVSLAKRAGHSILLMGWDDDMEVAVRDENGDVLLDGNGEPVIEKGFYAFKNSWGTSGFGIDHELGAGYGWISQRYIREFGRARIAGLPRVERPVEVCDDGVDNDFNGDIDCDDSACSADPACSDDGRQVSVEGPGTEIPDNDAQGASSPIRVDGDATTGLAGTISDLSVTIDIDHTFIGDLHVSLVRGDSTIVLHNRAGGSDEGLNETYAVADFNGTDFSGDWELVVSDNAGVDVGQLNSWTLTALVK